MAAIRHENVVAIFAVSETHGIPFLVMEYVRGRSLQDWHDSGKRFSIPEIVRIGRQIALGLAAAHSLRLIHRDIKPANVLLENGSNLVRISDFGLARAIDDGGRVTHDGAVVGTPLYMSPEQVNGAPLDGATDLFSLGSLLYTLCTGDVPFPADTFFGILQAVNFATPAPIRDRNPAIPERLVGVIERMHAKDPAQRPTAATVVAELSGVYNLIAISDRLYEDPSRGSASRTVPV